MDSIQIRGLKAPALIGVHDWERKKPRPLLFDLELACDIAAAAKTDALADALDYQAVADAVVEFAANSQYLLVETLAEALAAELKKRFKLKWMRMTVHKPGAVPSAQDISITIERGTRP